MGSIISTITGIGGAAHNRGMEWQAQDANILNPTTVEQARNAYDSTQNALGFQNNLIGALQGQNGIQNQSNVYNQLGQIAQGQGPNPAQAMLANATGQNVANQAALMAGQRGSSANAGLMARQAAMAGTNAQQQAAGQGAAMQAQQSMNALNSMGNMAGQQVGNLQGAQNAYSNTALQQQQNLLGGIASQNNANVSMVTGQNSANAGINSQIAQGQGNFAGNIMGAGGAAMGMFASGGEVEPNNSGFLNQMANTQPSQTPMPQMAPMENKSAEMKQKVMEMALKGAAMAKGGEVKDAGFKWNPNLMGAPAADQSALSNAGTNLGTAIGSGINALTTSPASAGGNADIATPLYQSPYAFAEGGRVSESGPRSKVAGYFASGGKVSTQVESDSGTKIDQGPVGGAKPQAAQAQPPKSENMMMTGIGVGSAFAHGGRVPAMVSPGEQYIPPKDVKKVAKGASPLAVGERIPGKPKVLGNSYANDVVPKTLQEGGIVIPNSVMQSKNPAENAAKFVAAILARKGHGLK